MRRIVAAMALVTMAGSLAPATAQPGATAAAGQEAAAWWVVMSGDTGRVWIADATRIATETGPVMAAFVGRGRCKMAIANGWRMTTCFARGRVKEVGIDEFQMDPALRTATLDVKIGKYRHRVEWAARGTPMVGQSAFGGASSGQAGATAATGARATGTVFNDTKVGKGCDLCYLAEGAGAAAWTSYAERDVSMERRGDRFVARLKVRERI